MLSRREISLLGIGLAGSALIPQAACAQPAPVAAPSAALRGLNLGATTYSFGKATIDDALAGLVEAGWTQAELHPYNVEPIFPGMLTRPSSPPTAAELAISKHSREALRQWRLSVPLDYYSEIGRKFGAAGLKITGYSYLYFGDLTDDEINRSFEATKAMGTDIMTAVGPKEGFARLDTFAKAHKVRMAIHNGGGMQNVEAFAGTLNGLSEYSALCLDVGHFFAGGGDPLDMLKKHRDRIICMHIKDRKRNNGPTVELGQGDTPLVAVLRWMRDNKFAAPANVEQEVGGWDRLGIAKRDIAYCKKALAT